MSKEKVRVILVVDASSSMMATRQETVDAVEELIKEHSELKDKKVYIQVLTFAGKVTELVSLTKLKEYNNNFTTLYNPCGMTALYDAIGEAVNLGKRVSKFDKTSLVILTDGEENASQEYDKNNVKNLLTTVQDDLGWDVTYLGANMANFDSYTSSLGIKLGKSVAFDPNQIGTRSASLKTASTRSMAYMLNK